MKITNEKPENLKSKKNQGTFKNWHISSPRFHSKVKNAEFFENRKLQKIANPIDVIADASILESITSETNSRIAFKNSKKSLSEPPNKHSRPDDHRNENNKDKIDDRHDKEPTNEFENSKIVHSQNFDTHQKSTHLTQMEFSPPSTNSDCLKMMMTMSSKPIVLPKFKRRKTVDLERKTNRKNSNRNVSFDIKPLMLTLPTEIQETNDKNKNSKNCKTNNLSPDEISVQPPPGKPENKLKSKRNIMVTLNCNEKNETQTSTQTTKTLEKESDNKKNTRERDVEGDHKDESSDDRHKKKQIHKIPRALSKNIQKESLDLPKNDCPEISTQTKKKPFWTLTNSEDLAKIKEKEKKASNDRLLARSAEFLEESKKRTLSIVECLKKRNIDMDEVWRTQHREKLFDVQSKTTFSIAVCETCSLGCNGILNEWLQNDVKKRKLKFPKNTTDSRRTSDDYTSFATIHHKPMTSTMMRTELSLAVTEHSIESVSIGNAFSTEIIANDLPTCSDIFVHVYEMKDFESYHDTFKNYNTDDLYDRKINTKMSIFLICLVNQTTNENKCLDEENKKKNEETGKTSIHSNSKSIHNQEIQTENISETDHARLEKAKIGVDWFQKTHNVKKIFYFPNPLQDKPKNRKTGNKNKTSTNILWEMLTIHMLDEIKRECCLCLDCIEFYDAACDGNVEKVLEWKYKTNKHRYSESRRQSENNNKRLSKQTNIFVTSNFKNNSSKKQKTEKFECFICNLLDIWCWEDSESFE